MEKIGGKAPWKKISYKTKLSLSYSVIILTACMAMGILSVRSVKAEADHQQRMTSASLAWEAGSKLNEAMQKVSWAVGQTAVDTQLKQVLGRESESYYQQWIDFRDILTPKLRLLTLQAQEAESFIIYTENEMLNHSKDNILPVSLIEGKIWFEEAKKESRMFWATEGDRLLGIYHLYMPADTAPEAFLVVTLYPADILDDEGGWNRQWEFLLRNGEGKTVLCSRDGVENTKSADRFLSSYQLCNGWELELFFEKRNLSGCSLETLFFTGIIAACALGLLGLSTHLFSDMFSRRLVELNQAMQQVIHGNRQVVLWDDSGDEIGQLTGTFNMMMGEINHLIEDVLENKIARREAELAALRTQIKPHFLYNALSTINWMAIRGEYEDISLVATSISDYYRTMLNGGQEMTTLGDELRNVQSYLTIQTIAHGDSFVVEYETEEGLKDCEMINMILQPFAENAVRHGIDKRKKEYGGWIRIRAEKKEGDLMIEIEDNGPGMDEACLNRLREGIAGTGEKGGYGIRNVQERIRFREGEPYGVYLSGRAGLGTKVCIRYPYRKRRKVMTEEKKRKKP